MDISDVVTLIGVTLDIIAVIAAASLLVSFAIMICWNLIMPALFGLPDMGIRMIPVLTTMFGGLSGGITLVCGCIAYRMFS